MAEPTDKAQTASCQANLKFMVGYLRSKGYDQPIQIRIVNEYDLTVLEEYQLDMTEDRSL